jgi:hypothetical protein
MSVQLKLDEMLEILQGFSPARAAAWERQLCAIGDGMALEISTHFDCIAGETTMQGVDFAGICCPFQPRRHGQPCPDALASMDHGGADDWNEHAAELPA